MEAFLSGRLKDLILHPLILMENPLTSFCWSRMRAIYREKSLKAVNFTGTIQNIDSKGSKLSNYET